MARLYGSKDQEYPITQNRPPQLRQAAIQIYLPNLTNNVAIHIHNTHDYFADPYFANSMNII